MEPLEQVTVLVTLMKRLGQVLDHERALLRSMPLEDLVDIQEEKTVLAEAYEIEFGRIRAKPEIFAALEPGAREQVETAMRRFQEAVSANMHALTAAQTVIEKLVRNVADSAARSSRHLGYGPPRPGRRCPRPGHPRRLRPQALGDPAMTITASLSSALSGLNAAQDSISVVAHNILRPKLAGRPGTDQFAGGQCARAAEVLESVIRLEHRNEDHVHRDIGGRRRHTRHDRLRCRGSSHHERATPVICLTETCR
jgi:hypothetical protein